MTAAIVALESTGAVPPQSQEHSLGQDGLDAQSKGAQANGSDQGRTDVQRRDVRTETGGSESESNGHLRIRCTSDDLSLPVLHALLGHYARQLWDLQKMRIMMGNRVGAMGRDELPAQWTMPMQATCDDLAALEHSIDLQMTRLARKHFMADWVKQAPGIGLPGFARLMGVTGSLDRFATVSKLWAYVGMHVVDGFAPKRQKGVKGNWSPQGRVVCHQIADSIVKANKGPYRAAYDVKKAQYEAERSDWTQARRHNAAMRYAVKLLLKDLWVEWRRRSGHWSSESRSLAAADVA